MIEKTKQTTNSTKLELPNSTKLELLKTEIDFIAKLIDNLFGSCEISMSTSSGPRCLSEDLITRTIYERLTTGRNLFDEYWDCSVCIDVLWQDKYNQYIDEEIVAGIERVLKGESEWLYEEQLNTRNKRVLLERITKFKNNKR